MALNLVDALFSAAFLTEGVMAEANPLMLVAWEDSPGTFLAAKTALVGLGAWALWRGGRRGVSSTALLVCLAAYAAVIGYHLLMVGNMLLIRS